MNTILALTDFSDTANNAVNYACRLAKASDAKLVVIHSYIIPVAFSDMPMPMMATDDARQIAEDRMSAFFHTLRDLYPGLDAGTKIMYGDIADCVEEYIEENGQPVLVVVGNSGTGNSSFMGSTTLNMLRHTQASVLAIPPATFYEPVQHICLASDLQQVSEKFPAAAVRELVRITGAQLHVLNIDNNNAHFKPDTPLESSVLHQLLGGLAPEYHYEQHEHTEEGIHIFLEQHPMNWLMITPHKRSFFEGLFHKSQTKTLMRITDIPVVALHEAE